MAITRQSGTTFYSQKIRPPAKFAKDCLLKAGTAAKWTIAVALLCLPVLVWFAIRAETNTHDLTIWLPSGTPQRAVYDQFISDFGSDESLLISWANCSVEGDELAELKSNLLLADEKPAFFAQVVSSEDALDGLRLSHPGSSEESLKRQLSGVFLGPDLQTAGLVVRLSEAGKHDRKGAVATVEQVIGSIPALFGQAVHIAGAPFVNVHIDRATNRSLLWAIPGGLLSMIACFICLRSIRLATITLFVACFSALASVAMVTMCGCQLNGMLIVTPVLVLVLSLSSGVHLSNYYRLALHSGDHAVSVTQAIKHGWLPTTVAIGTTILGFLTLSFSEIEAVRQFSFFSSLALLIALATLLTLFPAMLLVWPERWDWSLLDGNGSSNRIASFANRFVWEKPKRAKRFSAAIMLAFLAIGGVAIWGLPHIQTDLAPERLFSGRHTVSQNSRWLGKNFLPLNSLELIVTMPNSKEVPWHKQIETVRRIQSTVARLPFVQSSFSAAQLVPQLRLASSGRSTIQRSFFDSGFGQAKGELSDERWLAERDGRCAWRIWVGVSAKLDQPAKQWLAQLNEAALQSIDPAADVKISPTGMWLLSTIGRERLFSELSSSFSMAFVLIAPLVMLMLRSFWAGLVAMIPNVLPDVVLFGGLGWLGANVDISTILTASIGMGIAVDSTVHFLQWYRARIMLGDSRNEAVASTIGNCSRAMFFTTLISCIGLIAFSFSSFLPARQFALAIVTLLILALICDLLLTPALILSPVGFIYDRR